jgi:hypothetical protein
MRYARLACRPAEGLVGGQRDRVRGGPVRLERFLVGNGSASTGLSGRRYDHRTHRQRKHREHRRAAGRGRGPRRGSELLQEHLTESRVVKAFNDIYVSHLGTLQRPSGHPERSVLAIAGDDESAKLTVAEFLDSIAHDAYDAGGLSEGWRYQRDTAAYVQPYVVPGNEYPMWPGRPVTSAMLKEKLDAAVRYRDM